MFAGGTSREMRRPWRPDTPRQSAPDVAMFLSAMLQLTRTTLREFRKETYRTTEKTRCIGLQFTEGQCQTKGNGAQ